MNEFEVGMALVWLALLASIALGVYLAVDHFFTAVVGALT